MGEFFSQTAASGSLLLAIPIAVLAGLVSFLSPCVLPLLPGYLSYATGLSGADLADARRGRMVLGSTLFVSGFAAVFVAYGALFGSVGSWLAQGDNRRVLTVVMGSLTILLGVAFMGFVPFLQRDVRVHAVPKVGLVAAPFLGVLFGIGWTPCVGPTLGAILTLGITEGGAGRSALLSATYALGLGLPFIVAGLAYRRFLGAVGVIRRHQQWVTRLGGLMLVAVGVLLVTGLWDLLIGQLQVSVQGFTPGI
ncbi:cytochrome c biogenesis protein CcdA [Nocardioidaceae bacterium]|nr:cytochrome c biogenesis protein CcdA [Nocardioidaceae bacterium]